MKKTASVLGAFLLGAAVLVPIISLAGGSFYVDSTTGFVGVGNTTPTSPLDVAGAMYSRLVTASSTSIDWNQGNVQTMTLSSNPTLTFSNGQAGGEYKLILNQDATGGRTVTWPGSVRWLNGSAPILSSSASSTNVIDFVYDGADYLGSYIAKIAEMVGFNSATSTINSSGSASISATATIGTGQDRILVAFYDDGDSDLYSASSYNGNSLTRTNTNWPGVGYYRINTLYQFAPDSGTHTLSASDSSGVSSFFLHGVSYTGASQSGFPDATCTNSGTGSSISCTINTSTPGTWMVMHVTAANGTLSAGTNATLRSQPRGDSITVDSNGPIPTGGYTMTVNNSLSGQGLTATAVTIAPAQ